MKKEIKNAKTTAELDDIVTTILTDAGEVDAASGETYLETAERVRETNPDLAEKLEAAETRWFEIEG